MIRSSSSQAWSWNAAPRAGPWLRPVLPLSYGHDPPWFDGTSHETRPPNRPMELTSRLFILASPVFRSYLVCTLAITFVSKTLIAGSLAGRKVAAKRGWVLSVNVC